jgi:hypothetical protein
LSVHTQWTRRLEAVTVALIFLAGLWFFFGQLVATRFDAVPGDLGDSRFNAIVLEHGFRLLRGDAWHRVFWTPNWAFYPHKNVLAYSDNLIGTLPLYVAARAVGLGEMAAFNTWVVILSVANFISMALLLREARLSRLGAAVGGFVFAFAMPRGEQLNHLQLFPQLFTPLCFWCLLKMRSLRAWTVWGAVACAVLQLYAAVYVGWFLALALAICAVVTVFFAAASRGFRGALWGGFKRLWLHLVAAALLGMAALLPMAIHYANAQKEVGPRKYGEMLPMLPRVASYFLPADYTFLYHSMMLKMKQGLPVAHEHVMFAGFLVIACMAMMLVVLLRAPRQIAAHWWHCVLVAIWLTTVATTLFVDGSLWGTLHRVIPGAGGIRAVSRIVMLQLLPLGAAAAWAVTGLERRLGFVVAALFAALVVLENSGTAGYHFSARDHAARIERIKRELTSTHCDTFFLTGSDEPYKVQLDAMWASLLSKVPTINGYSGNTPRRWPFENPRDVRPGQLKAWLHRHHAPIEGLCELHQQSPRMP